MTEKACGFFSTGDCLRFVYIFNLGKKQAKMVKMLYLAIMSVCTLQFSVKFLQLIDCLTGAYVPTSQGLIPQIPLKLPGAFPTSAKQEIG